jgi:hypothetical protein
MGYGVENFFLFSALIPNRMEGQEKDMKGEAALP